MCLLTYYCQSKDRADTGLSLHSEHHSTVFLTACFSHSGLPHPLKSVDHPIRPEPPQLSGWRNWFQSRIAK